MMMTPAIRKIAAHNDFITMGVSDNAMKAKSPGTVKLGLD
jgi:hypothetical protein